MLSKENIKKLKDDTIETNSSNIRMQLKLTIKRFIRSYRNRSMPIKIRNFEFIKNKKEFRNKFGHSRVGRIHFVIDFGNHMSLIKLF